MKKQDGNHVMVEKMVVFVKTFDHYHHKFNLVTFTAALPNYKRFDWLIKELKLIEI